MQDTIAISAQTVKDFQNTTSSIGFKDFLGLVALFLSALVAVLIGQYLQNKRIKKDAKEHLFKTLFSLRGRSANYYYVSALNQIEIVFHEDKAVLSAWLRLYESFNEVGIGERIKTDEAFRVAKNKEWDKLKHQIIYEMANVLGYNLKVMKPEHLLNPAYSPEGLAVVEDFEWDLRHAEKEYYERSVLLQEKTVALLERSVVLQEQTQEFYLNPPSAPKSAQGVEG
jgi:hypothetical protein